MRRLMLGALLLALAGVTPTVASAQKAQPSHTKASWYSCRLTVRGEQIESRTCRTYAMPKAPRQPLGWWIRRSRIDAEHERSIRYPTFTQVATISASSSRTRAFAGLPGCPPAIARWAGYIIEASRITGAPVRAITGIMAIESGGNPGITNVSSGAAGLMQFLPSTAAAMGFNPYDPYSAILYGARYYMEVGAIRYSGGGYTDAFIYARSCD